MRKFARISLYTLMLLVSGGAGFAAGICIEEPPIPAAAVMGQELHPIEAFRTERQQLRQMQLSQLSEIIHSGASEAKMVALAQERQIELMEWSEQELTIEGILAMREFEDAVVTVHTDSVNVMVRAESVSAQQAAVIHELVVRETGISGGNVKIIPIN